MLTTYLLSSSFFLIFPFFWTRLMKAHLTAEKNSLWFPIPKSGDKTKMYRVYGWLAFTINNSQQKLALYQSQFLIQQPEYVDYLFLPFKDATNGKATYETGRYLDLKIGDIKERSVILDFNKAYNPYCAYVSEGYHCPIPPKENHLKMAIAAGEKKFAKND